MAAKLPSGAPDDSYFAPVNVPSGEIAFSAGAS